MANLPAADAETNYSLAKFLVDVFPEDATRLLCDGNTCNLATVQKEADSACVKLGSYHKVKDLVLNRSYEELLALKAARSNHRPALSPMIQSSGHVPLDFGSPRVAPPTPAMSHASGSQQSSQPKCEWIVVYDGLSRHQMTSKASGSDVYIIGDDKLERIHDGAPVNSPPKIITLRGQGISVDQYIDLTWNRQGDPGTRYKPFWVIPQHLIQDADVLLGSLEPISRGYERGYPDSCPPLALSRTPQAVPGTEFSHAQFCQRSSTSGFPTDVDSVHFGQSHASPKGVNGDALSYQRARPFAATAGVSSAPPLVHSPASPTGYPPSRADSVRSTATAKIVSAEVVLVKISFQSKGQLLMQLDLTMDETRAIAYVVEVVSRIKVGNKLDRSRHKMEVIPLMSTNTESESCFLDDSFGIYWEAMVEFIRQNRSHEPSNRPEFLVDIG